jgi:MarR family transcriptional regulator for hemolysin
VHLVRTARAVTQTLDRALVEAGGSASTWQILLLVHTERWRTQARMAEAMGVTSATLTHHLNALEARGVVRRWRAAANRRVQHVALTETGEALFDRLQEVAVLHEERLRSQLTDSEAERLGDLLEKVRAGLGEQPAGGRRLR